VAFKKKKAGVPFIVRNSVPEPHPDRVTVFFFGGDTIGSAGRDTSKDLELVLALTRMSERSAAKQTYMRLGHSDEARKKEGLPQLAFFFLKRPGTTEGQVESTPQ
jgi:hypothetical protein